MTAAEVLDAFLDAQGVAFEAPTPSSRVFSLRGEQKLSIGAVVELRERTLALRSFFIRRPLENEAAVYQMLLARNLRGGAVRFAADDAGDVYLVGELPLETVDDRAIDELLGLVVTIADEVFPHAVETGFATYLARDRAWREKAAAPRA